ncbi:hypothetical protein [Bacillus sp. SG-1]|uniref:hypothetical protein n=1 Tax=Bacillus sp. SG-1 TaxID=161544 RepID=UPI0002F8DE35|nr:hypothetical protein [Bacillus sp. SG-1]
MQIKYSKRKRSSYRLHSGSLQPIKEDRSAYNYTAQKRAVDRKAAMKHGTDK